MRLDRQRGGAPDGAIRKSYLRADAFPLPCSRELQIEQECGSLGVVTSSEFTGERVIPGQVNDDLWAEHISRYAFASRFAVHANVLDLGCGTGYGASELSRAARGVVGIDTATE